ncbi:serine/threonine-protein kinase VRK1-like [Diadema antillarum]|uniref:serine/threonine-protein kinase VRK1-like n=1 Tax=Diadema antillarum TaxID=105358 RepID=UPI003A89A281
MPPKGRKRAYQMPKPLPEGEVLKDTRKKEWKLGGPIGEGGFGLIYRADVNRAGKVSADAPYVVKIEPHENGPLFTELHCYQRVAQPEQVDAWQKKQKLSHLGVPKLCGSGSHQHGDVKYRFLVMQRFGEDIWKRYLAASKRFKPKTVFALALQILDSLEYLHCREYAHADIKSANLLLGLDGRDQNKVFLVDFGLASRFRPEGKHKDYKEDPRKGHNGTPEFTSIDAHKGVAPSRRGDIQILAYVMLQWLCAKLPWEDKLTDLNYVMTQKVKYSKDIRSLLETCFAGASYPAELRDFFQHAFDLGYEAEPDYNKLRKLCRQVLKREGFKEGSCFDFGAAQSAAVNGAPQSPGRGRAQSRKAPAAAKKKREPSKEDTSQTRARKQSRGDAAGPAGAAPSPARKTVAPKKTLAKAASGGTRSSHMASGKTGKGVAPKNVAGAGTSTPSRTERRKRTNPSKMKSSSTQTTPGLEKRQKKK